MQETTEQQKQIPPMTGGEKVGALTLMLDVLQGIGVMLGLAVLWLFESMRNVIFRALDRLNVKARPPRRVSAFPPGTPRKQQPR